MPIFWMRVIVIGDVLVSLTLNLPMVIVKALLVTIYKMVVMKMIRELN